MVDVSLVAGMVGKVVDDDARRFLSDVRGLIESSWTQQAEARAADGSPIDPWEPVAVSWSLLGALVAVYERRVRADGQVAAFGALARSCVRLAEVVESDLLSAWNDVPGRTQEDVVAALEDAGG
jgi:hypothetical protein